MDNWIKKCLGILTIFGLSLTLFANDLEGVEGKGTNTELVLNLFQKTAKNNAGEALEEIFSDDCSIHAFQEEHDLEFAKQFDREVISAFDLEKMTIHDCFERGDRVFVQWTFQCKHQGEYLDYPATGNTAVISGFSIYRLVNSKIVEVWQYWDRLGFYNQLSN